MTQYIQTQGLIGRTLQFAQRARTVMIEKGLNKAWRTCPWCKVKGGLEILLNENFNPDFIITCTATPDCLNYQERKVTPK